MILVILSSWSSKKGMKRSLVGWLDLQKQLDQALVLKRSCESDPTKSPKIRKILTPDGGFPMADPPMPKSVIHKSKRKRYELWREICGNLDRVWDGVWRSDRLWVMLKYSDGLLGDLGIGGRDKSSMYGAHLWEIACGASVHLPEGSRELRVYGWR